MQATVLRTSILVGILVLGMAAFSVGQGTPAMSNQIRDELFNHERDLANAEKQHDKSVFEKLLARDLVYIAFNGWVFNQQELLSKMQYVDVGHYHMANMKVRTIGALAAIVTYDLDVNAELGGHGTPSKQYVSSVWVKEKDGWKLLLHQATPATHP